MLIICATLGVCFKYITLLLSEISGTQKSGNCKNARNVVCYGRARLGCVQHYGTEGFEGGHQLNPYDTLWHEPLGN